AARKEVTQADGRAIFWYGLPGGAPLCGPTLAVSRIGSQFSTRCGLQLRIPRLGDAVLGLGEFPGTTVPDWARSFRSLSSKRAILDLLVLRGHRHSLVGCDCSVAGAGLACAFAG